MGVYDSDIAGALESIQSAGELCAFTLPPTKRATSKPWEDADHSSDPATDPVTVNGYVAFFPTGRVRIVGVIRAIEEGREIPGGFEMGLVGNYPVLSIKHTCKRSDNSVWSIEDIDPLNVNGELILQTVLFQKK